ncbi:MAG TPA: SDR family NAD(P)-dependent oxidoreductase [Stellaceae bacterium]|nr:SDR family NAD(P)-dependent oxidoreductase [Stellaceae bacterium]
MPKTIVITGASSGIGAALALRYARDGVRLGLLGRSEARLERMAAECRRLGAEVELGTVDVRARAEMFAWLEKFDAAHPVNLLFANAGVMAGRPDDGPMETAKASHALVETNVLGTLNTIHPLLPRMMARRAGQIAIVSSIAGFIPLADAPSYGASKAATLSYGLALRALLDEHGIRVSVICPGYVRTPMMEQESGPKPGAIEPAAAAELIVRGLERNKPVITFPFLFSLMTRIGGMLPDRLRRRTQQPYRFTVAERRTGE